MQRDASERGRQLLSPKERAFLLFESPNAHMHVGGVFIFAGAAPARDQLMAHIGAGLDSLPRYRQRVSLDSAGAVPCWVDDSEFRLEDHVQVTSLAPPGNEAQLQQVAATIFAAPLDRQRALWEIWVIDGLEHGRFAVVGKIHHCVANGTDAVALLQVLLSPNPGEPNGDSIAAILPARKHRPSTAPTPPRPLPTRLIEAWRTAVAVLTRPLATPLNQPIGPRRRIGWTQLPAVDVQAVAARLGGTANDALLTVMTGALRTVLARRDVDLDGREFRALVPVILPTRTPDPHASVWLLPLPIREDDPRRRHASVRDATVRFKAARPEAGVEGLLAWFDARGQRLLSYGVHRLSRRLAYNVLATNVAGPRRPLYLLGACLLAGYPLAPLFENQGVAFAFLRYAQTWSVGITADADLVNDVTEITAEVDAALDELREAAAPSGASQRGETSFKRP